MTVHRTWSGRFGWCMDGNHASCPGQGHGRTCACPCHPIAEHLDRKERL